MTDVVIQDKDVIVPVEQPTVPDAATPPKIGLVEINQVVVRGSVWTTGHGAPTLPGGQFGDMYLDIDTGDVYLWDGAAWDYQGTFAPATLTPAEILAALITVDGAGSNLDADLLDGQHGAFYAKQSDMVTQTNRNDTQDTQIAANSDAITGNTNSINTLQTDVSALEAGTTPAAILAKIITVDGPGSGLDADTLDGHDTAYFLPAGTYTAADILAKIKTVDGTGSGLDADLLDGQSGAYYLDLLNATGILPAARFNDTSHGARGGGNLHALATATVEGFMRDAPSDSFVYGRKNGAWSTVIGGATTDDAPPAGPLQDGQLWWKSSTGVLYLWYDDGNSQQWVQVSASPQIVDNNYARKTARRTNLVVNGALNVSQENGNTEGTTSGYYAADQFAMDLTAAGAAAGFSRVVVGTVNPSGSQYRLQLRVTTAKASLAAGDDLAIYTKFEGFNTLDLNWQSTTAQKDAVLVFGFKGPAGTYSVAIRNGAFNYSFLASFTITAGQANTDTYQTIKIPAPPAGAATWPVDYTASMSLFIVLASGSTFLAAAGWNTGNFVGVTGMSNGLAAVQTFQVWDIGLYADPDKTGLAPVFEVPDYATELAKCRRYWELWRSNDRVDWILGGNYSGGHLVPVSPKRVTPTYAVINHAGSNYDTVTLGTGYFEGVALSWRWLQGTIGVVREINVVGSANARM